MYECTSWKGNSSPSRAPCRLLSHCCMSAVKAVFNSPERFSRIPPSRYRWSLWSWKQYRKRSYWNPRRSDDHLGVELQYTHRTSRNNLVRSHCNVDYGFWDLREASGESAELVRNSPTLPSPIYWPLGVDRQQGKTMPPLSPPYNYISHCGEVERITEP